MNADTRAGVGTPNVGFWQVAIIGAGRISAGVIAHRGQPAVRRLLPLSLTFDHRVVTGGKAARFLVALKSNLERIS